MNIVFYEEFVTIHRSALHHRPGGAQR